MVAEEVRTEYDSNKDKPVDFLQESSIKALFEFYKDNYSTLSSTAQKTAFERLITAVYLVKNLVNSGAEITDLRSLILKLRYKDYYFLLPAEDTIDDMYNVIFKIRDVVNNLRKTTSMEKITSELKTAFLANQSDKNIVTRYLDLQSENEKFVMLLAYNVRDFIKKHAIYLIRTASCGVNPGKIALQLAIDLFAGNNNINNPVLVNELAKSPTVKITKVADTIAITNRNNRVNFIANLIKQFYDWEKEVREELGRPVNDIQNLMNKMWIGINYLGQITTSEKALTKEDIYTNKQWINYCNKTLFTGLTDTYDTRENLYTTLMILLAASSPAIIGNELNGETIEEIIIRNLRKGYANINNILNTYTSKKYMPIIKAGVQLASESGVEIDADEFIKSLNARKLVGSPLKNKFVNVLFDFSDEAEQTVKINTSVDKADIISEIPATTKDEMIDKNMQIFDKLEKGNQLDDITTEEYQTIEPELMAMINSELEDIKKEGLFNDKLYDSDYLDQQDINKPNL